MKTVIYTRVSSKEQEKEGYSIPAQLKKTREIAQRRGITVVKEFIEIESAKCAGRKVFNEMVGFLKKHQDIRGVICHKVDRLCRNFKDYVTIDELGVKPIFVEEDFPDNAAGKLTFGMKVLLAKHYIDNLSDEVKKGQREMLEQGYWPRGLPLGYVRKEKDAVFDPARCHLIARAYEWYATGNFSLKQLNNALYNEGLTTRSGKKLQKSNLAEILVNPFYYGMMVWHEKVYKGRHEPIVSKDLFDGVRGMLNRKNIPKHRKHDFVFRGLLRCGECGGMITASIQKGHNYYYCTRFKPCTQKKYIREEDVDGQVLEILKRVKIDGDVLEWVKKNLKDSHQDEKAYHDKAVGTLNQQYTQIQNRIDVLYDDKVDGKVTAEFYDRRFRDYVKQQEEILRKIENHKNANVKYFELGVTILELAGKVEEIYLKRDVEHKRELLKLLLSNLILRDKNLVFEWRKPFDLIVESNKNSNWLGREDSNLR